MKDQNDIDMKTSRPIKLAVVLFNLGGPDCPEAVQPFLKNLFMDPAILPMPTPVRSLLAWRISTKRAPITKAIYANLGGKSPLLELTQDQAAALEAALEMGADGCDQAGEVKVFVAMRYWHPRAKDVVAEVKSWAPDEVILLPLYPQYSTTTSGSSIDEWKREATAQKLIVATRSVCCYPVLPGFIEAERALLKETLDSCPDDKPVRVLFSAHGLPQSIVDGGDPYQSQIEHSVAAIVEALGQPDLEYRICYQSRVTRRAWLGPMTEDEIVEAGRDGVGIVIVPVAFVSEHSETLVELDIEYRELAEKAGVPFFKRVPTPGIHKAFIEGLRDIVAGMARQDGGAHFVAQGPCTDCCAEFGRCPRQSAQTRQEGAPRPVETFVRK